MRIPSQRFGVYLAAAAIVSSSLLLQAQLPQEVGEWAPAGAVSNSRTGAAAVALPDGRTLIAGGRTADGTVTDTILVRDAAGGVVVAGTMLAPRAGHAAALLADGSVLFAGGTTGDALSADLEIFDPAAGTSSLAGVMAAPRTGLAAARLADGSVLIAGGTGTDGTALAFTEIFDPKTGSIVTAADLQSPRSGASATTLIDGRVLVAGGYDGTSDLRTAEIFHPSINSFSIVDTQMSAPRSGHSALLLPHNNSVLIAGGSDGGNAQATADLFLPAEFPDPYSYGMGQFAAAAPMTLARSGGISGPQSEGFAFVSGGGAADDESYRFPTITTDKDDYAPGQLAIITGTGWRPEEVVRLRFQEDPAVHDDYVLEVTADGDGKIHWDQWAPEGHDLGVRFYLIARGVSSGRVAQTTFTDGQPRIIDATPTPFSPSAPSSAGIKDTTLITAKNQGGGNLTGFEIRIRQSDGTLIRTFLIGNVAANAEPTRIWDGKDTGGSFVADGTYTVRAFATGAGESTATNDSKTVVVDNTDPSVTLSAPADAAVVSGLVQLRALPVDAGGNDANIERVEFYVDDALVGADESGTGGGLWRFDYTPTPGSHTWRAKAFDNAGNNAFSPSRSFTDGRPTVTINQASGQADPTSASPILFAVEFSEPVSGFVTGDVTIAGTAAAGTTAAVSGGPTNYTVAVTGMSVSGTIIASIAQNVAVDLTGGHGNLASTSTDNTVTFNSDTTGPVITHDVTGTLGTNGWYTSDVNITWIVTDPQSAVSSKTGCDPASVTSDTAGTTFTCSATSGGGTTSVSVTIKRDASAPNAPIGTKTPEANADGWNNTNVTVSFATGGDNGPSGIAACSPSTALTAETTSTPVSGHCTDNAGNTGPDATVIVKIDKTKPVISGQRSPAANAFGWNNTDVAVSFTCADTGSVQSGIGSNDVAGTTLTTESANHSVTNTGTCVDKAGNAAVEATVSDIRIDKTAPHAPTGARSPAANAAGWNNSSPVDVTFSGAGDAGAVQSGIDECIGNASVTTETAGTDIAGTCTDKAGNTSDATTITVRLDLTKPVISGQRSPAANAFGWNNTDVVVSFTCADTGSVQSGIGSNDVAGTTLTTESANHSVTNTGTCMDKAGNAAVEATVSDIRIDKTAPHAPTGARSPAANAAGWNNSSPVDVTFMQAGDAGTVQSGIHECVGNASVTTETTGTDIVGTCTDKAGNTSDATTITVRLDLTKPVISGQRSPAANAFGWNNTDVAVSFTCADSAGAAPSGIASNTIGGATLTGEGANQSVTNTGTCVDVAGNAAHSATVSGINIDRTAPTIVAALDRAAAATGWFNLATGRPSVTFSCGDALSGLESGACPGAAGPFADGADQQASGSVTDRAGNTASASITTIDVDLTPPAATIVAPGQGSSYALNASVASSYSCSDAASGVAHCAGPVPNGSPFHTGSVGAKTFAVNAMDVAGNPGTASAGYSVHYATGVCLGSMGRQILEPVNADGSSIFKQKSTVPSKFRVCDANGVSIGTPGVVYSFALTGVSLASSQLPINEDILSTTPDAGFRWSPSDQQWIFNLSTKNLTAGRTYTYTIVLNDGTSIGYSFTLK